MTTMIPYWYGKPREFYDSPRTINMSHATVRLYDFLFWMSDRRSSRKFDVTDEDITQRTTLAKRTLALARKDLSQRGLIVCDRLPRGYTYQLCDLETGLPYPGDPKAKVIPKKKSSHTTHVERPEEPPTEIPATPVTSTPTAKDLRDTEGIPATPRPIPQPIPQHTLRTLPLRPNGERDYGFDKIF